MSIRSVPHSCWIHTAEQSGRIDSETIGSFGIDGFTLMEIAGGTIARHLSRRTAPGSHGLILCGKGNNGGDALCAARYLLQLGRRVTVVFISGTGDLSRDAATNLSLLRTAAERGDLPLSVVDRWEDADPDPAEGHTARHSPCIPWDFVLDGMIGTGLGDPLREPYAEAVRRVNRLDLPRYAIDVPSGLDADGGVPLGEAVRATETFACGTLKPGYYLGKGREYCGPITRCDLPFPNHLRQPCEMFLISRSWLTRPDPVPARHKYEAGVVYLIAGSEGLSGAALMAAESAWKTGVGAVIWVAPRGLLSRLEGILPQIIKKPVGGPDDLHFRKGHLPELQAILAEREGKVLVGPGLGRNPGTVPFVQKLLASTPLPFLIDADALRAMARAPIHRPADAEWILTPHPGELEDLLGESPGDDTDRLRKTASFCKTHGITVLSKGSPSVIGTAEGNSYITDYDTRPFSRAGFGDVLSGKSAGYWAAGCDALTSCAVAMIEGAERMEKLQSENSDSTPEPVDLI